MVIFANLLFWDVCTKLGIRELSISMIAGAHNNNFREIPKFANLSLAKIKIIQGPVTLV